MWFKVVLLVLFGAQAITNLVEVGGWRPQTTAQGAAGAVVIDILLFIGVLYYV